jgi:tetratricopeptide (TPR) repeat protein
MARNSIGRHLALLGLLAFLQACSTLDTTQEAPVSVEKPPEKQQRDPEPEAPVYVPPAVDPGVVAAYAPLLAKAQEARSRGDYEQALAYLERAQRIDPDSAEIYLALAKTHAARGDRRQASATAERGLLYCGGKSQCADLRAYLH